MTVTLEKSKSWAEKKSRENLIGMYTQELLSIVDGACCCDLIPFGVRKRLMRDGVLQKLGNKYSITSLGKNVLGVEDSAD